MSDRPKIILERLESDDEGTFGVIRFGGVLFYTGELPWRENHSEVSCIPEGAYPCSFTFSPHLKVKTYYLQKTAPRTEIRIHAANFMGDVSLGYRAQVNGCIALGFKIGKLDGQKAILYSSSAIRSFEQLLASKAFDLTIYSREGSTLL